MGLDHDSSISSGLHLVLGLALTTSTTQKLETFTPSPPSNKVDVDDDNKKKFLVRATSSPKKPYYYSHQDEEEPSLTLGLYCEEPLDLSTQTSSSPLISAVSSFSSGRVVMKRERELSSEETGIERVSSRVVSDEDEDGNNARKKLRLNKEQSALLEESFKQHSTLNPKQKQALARQLNLTPRQVEVWFQNRRARTKLKQTEVDCEFLKKCCETLTDENRRLHKELQELKAMKLAQQPLYMPMPMPAATLTMCPSCERLGHGVVSGGPPSKTTPFSISISPYNPFTNSSAAC